MREVPDSFDVPMDDIDGVRVCSLDLRELLPFRLSSVIVGFTESTSKSRALLSTSASACRSWYSASRARRSAFCWFRMRSTRMPLDISPVFSWRVSPCSPLYPRRLRAAKGVERILEWRKYRIGTPERVDSRHQKQRVIRSNLSEQSFDQRQCHPFRKRCQDEEGKDVAGYVLEHVQLNTL